MNPREALRHHAQAWVEPLLARAARAYVPGPRLEDALSWVPRLQAQGMGVTLGYFNADAEPRQSVLAADLAAIDALTRAGIAGSHLSVKAPALDHDEGTLHQLAAHAAAAGQILHFDAHGPQTAQPTLDAVRAVRPVHASLGITLPGRWRRSLKDAGDAAFDGLFVRVVKGQWDCPESPGQDPRAGFLAVIERLAGRPAPVAVATHDPTLARAALERLRRTGTPCEIELLCGLPRTPVLAVAREFGTPVRLYLPFGQAWLPYAFGQVVRQPRLWGRLLIDAWEGRRMRSAG
jgi:proline dehydrogenase